MRFSISSWRETLTKLGLVYRKVARSRKKTRPLRMEPLAARRMLAADLDSPLLDEAEQDAGADEVAVEDAQPSDARLDVDNNGHVTPLDALLIANALIADDQEVDDHGRLDVNQDGQVTAGDLWPIVDHLNAQHDGAANGDETDVERGIGDVTEATDTAEGQTSSLSGEGEGDTDSDADSDIDTDTDSDSDSDTDSDVTLRFVNFQDHLPLKNDPQPGGSEPLYAMGEEWHDTDLDGVADLADPILYTKDHTLRTNVSFVVDPNTLPEIEEIRVRAISELGTHDGEGAAFVAWAI